LISTCKKPHPKDRVLSPLMQLQLPLGIILTRVLFRSKSKSSNTDYMLIVNFCKKLRPELLSSLESESYENWLLPQMQASLRGEFC